MRGIRSTDTVDSHELAKGVPTMPGVHHHRKINSLKAASIDNLNLTLKYRRKTQRSMGGGRRVNEMC